MRKFIYAALGMILIGIIGVAMILLSTDLLDFEKTDAQKKTADSQGISEIQVDAGSLDVTVEKTTGRTLTAEIQGWGNGQMTRRTKLEMQRHGQALHILADQNPQFFAFSFGWKKLAVKVPAQLYQSITVHSGSGDVSVQSLRANDLSVTTNSGDITAENNQAPGNFTAKASSGDIVLKQTRAVDQVSVTTRSGDIDLTGLVAGHSYVNASSGDITVRNFSGDLSSRADAGDLVLKSERLSGNLSAEASSGDVIIGFNQDPDSLTLDYRGRSGEGIVMTKGLLYKEKLEDLIIGRKGNGKYHIKVRTNSGDFVLR
ncbi:DUF4097 family beta strand repeat-containing protein [Sporolactobacillus sp. THM19-2]|uniref:DUF4097 family beta strand repeat-containing protein n=1 Tax=Sporolactobacillus sp. THM19-2 TaxID=2511171 RepID=UPI00102283EB|nr:DUF4097 family beta strand repeat-containing protein [Sporolactobacillus sp. THM19-2]RYL88872.1 hypothetical protein EWH91_11090 [Sporolactobacillus sp. THM19-2]